MCLITTFTCDSFLLIASRHSEKAPLDTVRERKKRDRDDKRKRHTLQFDRELYNSHRSLLDVIFGVEQAVDFH
jgi:hypothetical protein